MRPPLRIAVLECDTPVKDALKQRGTYGDIFADLLRAGADACDLPDVVSRKHGLEFSKFDVVGKQEYPQLEDVDALLLTGSKHNSFDNDEWILKLVAFTEKVLAQDRVRLIGVCYGHQIIGRALGTKVGRSELGWETSVSIMKLSEKGKEIFEKDVLSIHQMHQDVVFTHPPGVEPLGSSPRCEVQGMYQRKRLISVQGHPEFDTFIMRLLLEGRHDGGVLNDEVYNDGIGRVANHHDGVAVSKAFIKFLLDD